MTKVGGAADPVAARAAFEDLYRGSYRSMFAVAMATTRERALAEDMTQDAYAQLWVRWDRVDAPRAWLRRAVVSNCVDALRTRRRREGIIRRQPVTADVVGLGEDRFVDLLHGLTQRQRVAVTLRFVEDLSEADIAAALGCRPGTVKSSLHRAMRTIRTNLQGDPS
ncbi:MAG: sigma-70 family RNA polymerase sigma factor [Actinomycetota bacterium]|nr:sigma-70 family RNA polymerase sigma factor [Actinomycetota bacterium]